MLTIISPSVSQSREHNVTTAPASLPPSCLTWEQGQANQLSHIYIRNISSHLVEVPQKQKYAIGGGTGEVIFQDPISICVGGCDH